MPILMPVLLGFLAVSCLINRLDPGHAKKFDKKYKHWIEANFKR